MSSNSRGRCRHLPLSLFLFKKEQELKYFHLNNLCRNNTLKIEYTIKKQASLRGLLLDKYEFSFMIL